MPEEGDRLRALEGLRSAKQGSSDVSRERDVLDLLLAQVHAVVLPIGCSCAS